MHIYISSIYIYKGLRTQKSGKAEPSANRSASSPVNQHMSRQSAEAENVGYRYRSYIGVIQGLYRGYIGVI